MAMMISEGVNAYKENDRVCGRNLIDFSKCDMNDENFMSKEVKIWTPKNITIQPTSEGPYEKDNGPFKGLWKFEARVKSEQINALIEANIDLSKPDQVLIVKPRRVPEKQICKFSGK